MGAWLAAVAAAWLFPWRFPRRDVPMGIVRVHDAVMLVWGSCLFAGAIAAARRYDYWLYGNPSLYGDEAMCEVMWLTAMYKTATLLDTAILLWRGRPERVTGRHVYERLFGVLLFWKIAHEAPCGDTWALVVLHTSAQLMVYAYWLVATFVDATELKRVFWVAHMHKTFYTAQVILHTLGCMDALSLYPRDLHFLGAAYNACMVHLL